MKRAIIITMILFTASLTTFGQSNPIDALFNKYSGREGITTIFISSRMFQMIAGADLDDEELTDLMSRLKSIRILTVEDSVLNSKLNFYKELSEKLDFSKYEEMMVVKEGGKDLKFLVRGKGNKIEEFLMVGGGGGSNILVSIKGDLDMDKISDISKTMGIEEMQNLDKKKAPVKKDE